MALWRRTFSGISDENFNWRLQREKAKTGAISVSLAWNDLSNLDLHAKVFRDNGRLERISFNNRFAAGGYLDVDMHARDGMIVQEPVENIFWSKPPAGLYSISVRLYKKRGTRDTPVPFKALLKREGEQDLKHEGAVEFGPEKDDVECFRFTVGDKGGITIATVGTPLLIPTARSLSKRSTRAMRVTKSMKAMKAMKVMKVMKVMKAMKRVSKIARGKKAKAEVWRGKKEKTVKGLRKEDLLKSKSRKIVSARKSKAGTRSKWARAIVHARAIKGYTGFRPIKKGTSFYAKAKELLAGL